jgi:hypothetical protein
MTGVTKTGTGPIQIGGTRLSWGNSQSIKATGIHFGNRILGF